MDKNERGADAAPCCPPFFAVDRSAIGDASAGNRITFGPARERDLDDYNHNHHAPGAGIIAGHFTGKHVAINFRPGSAEQRTNGISEEKNRHGEK